MPNHVLFHTYSRWVAKPIQGPFGTGMNGPSYGMCPIDRDWMVEDSDGMNWMRAPPEAPKGFDGTDVVMRNLALKKINTFSLVGHGFYFWNFRTELPEPRWSYMLAVQNGWIPSGASLNIDDVSKACEKEDNGQYKCVAKRGMISASLLNGIRSCLSRDPSLEPQGTNISQFESLNDEDLASAADTVFNDFWTKYRLEGVTCDFGGVAQLMESDYKYVPRSEAPSNSTKNMRWTTRRFIIIVPIFTCALILVFILFGKFMMQRGGDVREATLRKLGAFRNSFGRFSYAFLGDANVQN